MLDTVNERLLLVKAQLKIVDLIPAAFEPIETAMGFDRDMLESLIYEWDHGKYTLTKPKYLGEFSDYHWTLKDYIALYVNEIKALGLYEYTDPASVHVIMDAIGTTGVLNTDNGLIINRSPLSLLLAKGEWLASNAGRLSKVSATDYHQYGHFIKAVAA
jgi:hypothetical protein